MSLRALLLAVSAKVKTVTGLDAANVGVQEDGQPPNFSGELYIAIHPGAFRNNDDAGETDLDEVYEVDVTVSRRAGYTPADRVGEELITKVTTGLYARVEAIRAGLHMQYDYIIGAGADTANTIIGASDNGFVKPLKFRDCSRPQRKGAEWFGAEKGKPGGKILVLSFGGAQRVQIVTEQS